LYDFEDEVKLRVDIKYVMCVLLYVVVVERHDVW